MNDTPETPSEPVPSGSIGSQLATDLSTTPVYCTGRLIVSRKQIVAETAKWAIRQSPYVLPDKLTEACEKLYALLPSGDEVGFVVLTRRELENLLSQAIKQIPEILAWNNPRSGHQSSMVFVSRYDKPSPDDDYIDLDALVRNVQMSLARQD